MSFYTQSILQNCITILILLETVVQYESKRVTPIVSHEEYVLEKPDLEVIKEEPTPRCRFMSQSHNSHRYHNHHVEEDLSTVTDAPVIDKWHLAKVDQQPSSNEAGLSFWNNNELSDDDIEAHHNQHHNQDDQQEHHDSSFYNLINHKFWAPDTAEWDRHRKQLDDNWKAWMKVVSFFPSGQKQLSKQIPLSNHHDNELDRSTVTSTATSSLSRPVQAQKVLVKQTIPVQVNDNRKQEDTIKESPPPTGAVSSTKEDSSELEQQDPVRMLEPVTMHYDELPIVKNPSLSNERETQQERPELITSNRSVFEDSGWDVSSSTSLPSASERVRNSLLKAADVARHLNQRALNATTTTTTTTTRSPQVSLFNPNNRQPSAYDLNTGRSFDTSREIWSADELVTSPILSNSSNAMEEDQLRPMFLGFGQVQRNDPFNGNMRTQARLSCQFGDATGRNLTISNVEWARFKGNYEIDKVTPDFDCKTSSCKVESVRTDVSTTVHPRPAIQNYIDTLIPSYSVTLHDVSEDQLGVYRCSALRQLEGRKELVYRIIQFE